MLLMDITIVEIFKLANCCFLAGNQIIGSFITTADV